MDQANLQSRFAAYANLKISLGELVDQADREFRNTHGLVQWAKRKISPDSEQQKTNRFFSFFNGLSLWSNGFSLRLTKCDEHDFEYYKQAARFDAVQNAAPHADEMIQRLSEELSSRVSAIHEMLEVKSGKKERADFSFYFVPGDVPDSRVMIIRPSL